MHDAEALNGNGIFGKVGKYSWVITVLALLGGPFGSYMLFRQDMTVEIAKLQLQITQHDSQLEKLEKQQQDMVPKQVHETRWQMQSEVEHWKEKYYESQIEDLKERLKK